ncbi:MAG TPA: NAD(P)/FAD-dependent oxidoreductase [Casimicrobiaceae bacterium]|nr:NAD(P)/FAD-dependent oxidoreductase [Casimicrobiaceae bacterium]
MNTVYDVAVIGGGPAGLAAATLAARYALATVLFDEQPRPGGQRYGAPMADGEGCSDNRIREGHDDELVAAFRRSGATAVFDATVWMARRRDEGSFEIGVAHGPSGASGARLTSARALIVATGALARPFPIPGSTLHGVVNAADADALLRSTQRESKRRIVLAGNGPLLWELAAEYLAAGVALEALVVTTPRAQRWRALPRIGNVISSPDFLRGLALEQRVRRSVRVVRNVTALVARGRDQVETLELETPRGIEVLQVDLLVLHQGLVPEMNFGSALGCAYRWNDAQACFEPVVDAWGGSTLPGVFFAGDAASIAGAAAAEARGQMAALAVANALGRIDARARDAAAEKPRAALRGALRGRAFLDALHRPADAYRIPRGDTVVCRCENVTAEDVLAMIRQGASGPNQVKAFARCGMGPCQGRGCGLTVTELIARERKIPPADAGYFRLRWPVKPILLCELAALPSSAEGERAVARDAAH